VGIARSDIGEKNEADGSVDTGYTKEGLTEIEGSVPEINEENLLEELVALGFTNEEASKYREVFLKCGINSIEGAEPTSSTATIDDLICYRIVMDEERTLIFTIDNRELFYIALNGTDVYDSAKGGFLISIEDIHIPEREISSSVRNDLELKTQLLLDQYFVNAIWYSNFIVARSDNDYLVRCDVYCENRMGVKDTVTAFVYYNYNGVTFEITAITIDGIRYK
jgi:hypothetical protein